MISLILPAYNEEDALPPLLEAIAEVRSRSLPDLRVFVIDDGSADSTTQVVSDAAISNAWIHLVKHEKNQGLSQAIQTGFHSALQDAGKNDVIITLDADNTQPPDTISAMLARMEQGADVVVASRFRRGSRVDGVPFMRRIYSFVMSILFQTAFPVRGVRDYSCGFRAYRASVLQQAYSVYGDQFITERGFACMVEILFQLSKLKSVQFGEVPFILHYDLKPTETKMNVGKTIRDTLRLAFRHRFAKK